jgi:hypothetical protein
MLHPQVEKEKTIARELISHGKRDKLYNLTNKPTLKTLCCEAKRVEMTGNKMDLIDYLLSKPKVGLHS